MEIEKVPTPIPFIIVCRIHAKIIECQITLDQIPSERSDSHGIPVFEQRLHEPASRREIQQADPVVTKPGKKQGIIEMLSCSRSATRALRDTSRG